MLGSGNADHTLILNNQGNSYVPVWVALNRLTAAVYPG